MAVKYFESKFEGKSIQSYGKGYLNIIRIRRKKWHAIFGDQEQDPKIQKE